MHTLLHDHFNSLEMDTWISFLSFLFKQHISLQHGPTLTGPSKSNTREWDILVFTSMEKYLSVLSGFFAWGCLSMHENPYIWKGSLNLLIS